MPPDIAEERVLARGVHEGGVDVRSMAPAKISSIVARMQRDLHPPLAAEGFDEVLQIGRTGTRGCAADVGSENAELVLSRIWSLAAGDSVVDE